MLRQQARTVSTPLHSYLQGQKLLMSSLVVVTPVDPATLASEEPSNSSSEPSIPERDQTRDALDQFNHPRLRRALILSELKSRAADCDLSFAVETRPLHIAEWQNLYAPLHSPGLLDFLMHGWERWCAFREGRSERPLKAGHAPLLRASNPQRPSRSPLGQMSYYCTDEDTPVFSGLLEELCLDGNLIRTAVNLSAAEQTIYAMVTHPGHHAARDCFGGYCYVNHVAAMARLLQHKTTTTNKKVAILDVDYHVGNGTASLFYDDASVLVVSLHCDPDHDYPFHSGFADERGHGHAEGTTLHLPLPPGTEWPTYAKALEQTLQTISDFGPHALLISMGLDTHDQDPVCVRRAGFHLQGDDYRAMGTLLAEKTPVNLPVIFLQEGGYRMDRVAGAAADVVTSFCQARKPR